MSAFEGKADIDYSAMPNVFGRQFGSTNPKAIRYLRDEIRSQSPGKPLFRLLIRADVPQSPRQERIEPPKQHNKPVHIPLLGDVKRKSKSLTNRLWKERYC
jgi:hypothetical protein